MRWSPVTLPFSGHRRMNNGSAVRGRRAPYGVPGSAAKGGRRHGRLAVIPISFLTQAPGLSDPPHLIFRISANRAASHSPSLGASPKTGPDHVRPGEEAAFHITARPGGGRQHRPEGGSVPAGKVGHFVAGNDTSPCSGTESEWAKVGVAMVLVRTFLRDRDSIVR